MNRTFFVAWQAPRLRLFDPSPQPRHVPFLLTSEQARGLLGASGMLDELVKIGTLVPLTVFRRDDVFRLRAAVNDVAERLIDSIPTVDGPRRPRIQAVPGEAG